jgi:TfoX/Sxy family transcriptional regulator of competence genes
MASDAATVERVRRALAGRPGIEEKRMVGGLSFAVDGSMCCGVTGAALMVRVGRDGMEQALTQPHVRPMALGGRTLSGFICEDPASALSDAELAAWVQRGLDVAGQLPPRKRRPPRRT